MVGEEDMLLSGGESGRSVAVGLSFSYFGVW